MRSCFFLCLFLGACTRVVLPLEKINPSINSLVYTNRQEILIRVEAPLPPSGFGHQYLFFFPVTSIHLEQPTDYFATKAYEVAALKGFRPTFATPTDITSRADLLEIKVKNIELAAFDLIFTRRLYCALSIQGMLYKNGLIVKQYELLQSNRSYHSFGFAPQLMALLSKTSSEGLTELFKGLGL